MAKIKDFFGNKWFKFSVATIIYVLWFVVWAKLWWMIPGVVLIYDYYISKLYMKLFWAKHLEKKKSSKAYKEIAGWIEAILFAVIVAFAIRMYFIEMYVIPTSSMEKTLLVGDYLGVNKFYYGTKMPNTPLSFPFVHNVNPLKPNQKSYLEWIKNPYRRLKGVDKVKRNDVVVFNYPEGDTVATVAPQNNYYQLVRHYGRDAVKKQSDIMVHPVDKRDNYIKRAVAVPGDVFQVKDGYVYINGIKEQVRDGVQFTYEIKTDGSLSASKIEELGVTAEDMQFNRDGKTLTVLLPESKLEEAKAIKGVESIERIYFIEPDLDVFPHDTTIYKWGVDSFGPLEIPSKGSTVKLTKENLPIYDRIIRVYEGNELEIKGDEIFINGQKSDSYTFNMDYYFMMGDNRHNSLDSRFWGFVPEDHVVGKASFVWFSVDKNKSFPKNIRFNRMFRAIN